MQDSFAQTGHFLQSLAEEGRWEEEEDSGEEEDSKGEAKDKEVFARGGAGRGFLTFRYTPPPKARRRGASSHL